MRRTFGRRELEKNPKPVADKPPLNAKGHIVYWGSDAWREKVRLAERKRNGRLKLMHELEAWKDYGQMTIEKLRADLAVLSLPASITALSHYHVLVEAYDALKALTGQDGHLPHPEGEQRCTGECRAVRAILEKLERGI